MDKESSSIPPKSRNYPLPVQTPPASEYNGRFNGTGKIAEEGIETLS